MLYSVAAQEVIGDLGIRVAFDFNLHSHCLEIARKANITANAILYAFVCRDIDVYMKAFYSYYHFRISLFCMVTYIVYEY